MAEWRYPPVEDLVCDLLERELDEGVYIGTWEPPVGSEFVASVLVSNTGGGEYDGTSYPTIDIHVESDTRRAVRLVCSHIRKVLDNIRGKSVNDVLVDDVEPLRLPAQYRGVNDSTRTEVMSFQLTFRKQFF